MAENIRARILTLAVNQMAPTRTPILDKVFGRKLDSLDTNTIEIKITKGTRTLMAAIALDAAATVTTTDFHTKITLPAPRFSEKELITAAKLAQIDAAMGRGHKAKLKEEVSLLQSDKKAKFDRTREFMAVKALEGVVVDGDGNQLADYGFPAALKPVMAGTDLWTDAASDPMEAIEEMKREIIIQSDGAVTEWVAWAGKDVMAALRRHPRILELAKSELGASIVRKGHISELTNTTIETHEGYYRDGSNTVQQMIPDNVFVLVGLCPDGAGEAYAPVVDLEAGGGVGSDGKPQIFFSKMWDEEDPSGKWVKVEGRPLPVLGRLISCWAEPVL